MEMFLGFAVLTLCSLAYSNTAHLDRDLCQIPGNANCDATNINALGCCPGSECQPWAEDGEYFTGKENWYCQYTGPIGLNGNCNEKQGKCALGLTCLEGVCSEISQCPHKLFKEKHVCVIPIGQCEYGRHAEEFMNTRKWDSRRINTVFGIPLASDYEYENVEYPAGEPACECEKYQLRWECELKSGVWICEEPPKRKKCRSKHNSLTGHLWYKEGQFKCKN